MKLFVCLVLIVVCSAQVPTPCDTPNQWVGRRLRVDRFRKFTEFASHSYDEDNKRTRTIEEIERGTERDFYDTIHLYNERIEYRLNLRTKQCNTTVLTRPFRPLAVPGDAHFLFEAEIGAAGIPGEHLTAATFDGKFPDGDLIPDGIHRHEEERRGNVEFKCLAYGHNRNGYSGRELRPFTPEANTKDYTTVRFYDLHLGIDDPTVFFPPKECM